MKITVTCPRYFSEIKNLENNLNDKKYLVESFKPTGQGFNAKEMIKNLENSQIAIIGDDEINDDVVTSCQNLELIIKWGVGVDNINISNDFPTILNTPSDIYIDVAEHVIYLIGSLLKDIPNIHKDLVTNGNWSKPTGSRLMGKNVGFIGYGKIARHTAELLNPFQVNQFFYDPYVESADNLIAQKQDMSFLQKTCDIFVVTTSLTKETQHLLDKKFFNHLSKKPYIINVSRGQIINEEDLIGALKNNLILGCALDVFEKEPISNTNGLKMIENIICSTHNASNTIEANNSVNQQVTDTLLKWISEQN